MLLVVSYALGQGWRTAPPMTVGVALGDFTAMTLSMLGLGALLAASATLFTIRSGWVQPTSSISASGSGARARRWTRAPDRRGVGSQDAGPRLAGDRAQSQEHHLLRRFLPAFLDPQADFLTQMLVFETTFLVLAFANAFGYALVASRARRFANNPRAIGVVNKVGGGLLVGAGAATVTLAGSRS